MLSKRQKVLPRSRKIKCLSGPIFASFYPNIQGRRLLILGEIHDNETICENPETYQVHRWIKDLAEHSEIDLFVESPYWRKNLAYEILLIRHRERHGDVEIKNLRDFDFPLEAIRDMFSLGMTYKNINYHPVDSRTIGRHENLFVNMFSEDEEHFFETIISAGYSDDDKISLLHYISGCDRSTQFEKIYDSFYSHMYEQYSKRSSHEKTGRNFQNAFFKLIDSFAVDIEKFYDCLFKSYKDAFEEDEDTLGDIISVIHMDVYFLLSYLTSNGKHSIIYSGAYHSKLYDAFLIRWCNTFPEFKIDGEISCIHFETEFDFFE